MVQFIAQRQWADAKGPMNVEIPSPVLATKGDQDPQWLKDLRRDGVSPIFDILIHSEGVILINDL